MRCCNETWVRNIYLIVRFKQALEGKIYCLAILYLVTQDEHFGTGCLKCLKWGADPPCGWGDWSSDTAISYFYFFWIQQICKSLFKISFYPQSRWTLSSNSVSEIFRAAYKTSNFKCSKNFSYFGGRSVSKSLQNINCGEEEIKLVLFGIKENSFLEA